MMRMYCRTILLLLGILVLAGCPTTGSGDGGEKLSFPVLDGLSSASILRLDNKNFAYVAETGGGGYKLNKVNVDNPAKPLIGPNIKNNVAIQTAANGKIALIAAEETGNESFIGGAIKIYDAVTLKELKSFDFVPPDAEGYDAEPLHHRDAGFSLGDKYVAAASEVDGIQVGGKAQQFISIYDVAGSAAAIHVPAFNPDGTTNPDLGIGTLLFVSTWGDYLIAGGNPGGTAVFKINNGGGALSITRVEAPDGVIPHWAISNGKYVLESKAGSAPGKVKVWKWNEGSKPTAVGTANTGDAGTVQSFSFDQDEDDTAYVFGRGAMIGDVYRVDLTTAAATKVFTIKEFKTAGRGTTVTNTLGTIWTLEHRTSGADEYYVLSGQVTTGTSGGVLVVKNPGAITWEGGVTAALGSPITLDTQYASAVRTMKTFVSSGGDIYYAAKNYSSTPLETSPYVLQLKKIND
jgi:hypothetical protein